MLTEHLVNLPDSEIVIFRAVAHVAKASVSDLNTILTGLSYNASSLTQQQLDSYATYMGTFCRNVKVVLLNCDFDN